MHRLSENLIPEAEMDTTARGISVRYLHSGSQDPCKRRCSVLFSLPSNSVLKALQS